MRPGWREARLKNLAACPITNGLGEAAADGDPGWPRYVRTTDIASLHALDPTKRVTLPPEVANGALIQRGDILMTAAGSLGTSHLYDSDEPACYAGYLVRFRPDPSVCDGRYIAWWTQSKHHLDQVATGAVRSTIDNFSAGKFRAMSVPVPPLAEQHAIAAFLDRETAEIDDLVSKQESLIETLRERRAAVVEWELSEARRMHPVKVLKVACEHVTVGIVVTPARWYEESETRGTPAVRGTNITESGISEKDLVRLTAEGHALHEKSRLRSGDVVIVRTGKAGLAAVVEPRHDGWNAIDVLLVRPRASDLDPRYLAISLNSATARGASAEVSVGSIQGHLNVGAVRNTAITMPPLNEQRRIADYLDEQTSEIDSLISKAEEFIALAKERRSALITAAVTGQIDMPPHV